MPGTWYSLKGSLNIYIYILQNHMDNIQTSKGAMPVAINTIRLWLLCSSTGTYKWALCPTDKRVLTYQDVMVPFIPRFFPGHGKWLVVQSLLSTIYVLICVQYYLISSSQGLKVNVTGDGEATEGRGIRWLGYWSRLQFYK